MTVAFGPRWHARIVADAIWVATPAGMPCYDCTEAIEDGDRGFVRPIITGERTARIGFVHAECDLRSVLGHDVGFCRHTGHPAGRATARLVWAAFYG